jgi:hypothetical protein
MSRFHVEISPEVLAELQDLARRHDVGNRTSTLLHQIRAEELLAEYQVLDWDADRDEITVQAKDGARLHMVGVKAYLGDAVETLVQAGLVTTATGSGLLALTGRSANGEGLLRADVATRLTWIVALLTALFQVAKFGADAAGVPLSGEVADAADALAAVATVLILIVTHDHARH